MIVQAVVLIVWLLVVVWAVWWCLATLLDVSREERARGEHRARERHPAGKRRKGPNDLAPWDRL